MDGKIEREGHVTVKLECASIISVEIECLRM